MKTAAQITEERCEQIADRIMFGKFKTSELPAFGLQYRKGCGYQDIRRAITKATKADVFAKVEHLRGWLTMYLGQVLKPTKGAP